MRGRRALVGVLLAVELAGAPAAAHHTGVYTPKDNAVTTNFKQLKFSVEARKFDVARRLFDEGPLRAEMRARADALPPGLEARTRAALDAGDVAEVERGLMVFFAALGRDLAREADRQLAAGATPAVTASRFLEAIWRYYNLIDFAVGRRDARASVAMRLAYDDAEPLARAAAAAPVAVSAAKLRESFARIARILTAVVDAQKPAPTR
ncbi:MAG TPA: hypothetical protein VFV05_06095 [Methylomirabilota bacterium]|nr:hypothetical protein [Methylomirabilota bacterium]